MLPIALCFFAQLASTGPFDSRLETLRFHVERLHAITVVPEAERQRAAKLQNLADRLDEPVEDEEQFNALYFAIDEARTWLLAHSAAKPERASGEFVETADSWSVKTPQLALSIARDNLAMLVQTDNHTWHFAASDESDVEHAGERFAFRDAATKEAESFHTGYSAGMSLRLAGFAHAPELEFRLTISIIGSEVVFDLAAKEDGQAFGLVQWPKQLELPALDSVVSVIPRMQGMLLPGNWHQPISAGDLCNSRSFYMPWWGQIQSGHGVQVILETSDDGGGFYHHPEGGPTRMGPRWYPSMAQFRYARTLRYVFSENATYVSMSKRYRRYVQESGQFVSLKEKLARTPALAEVIGKPVIHVGALYHFVQEASLFHKDMIERNHALNTLESIADGLRRTKANGIDRAYVHLDGWGFYGYDNGHPDVLPAGQEQGGWDGLQYFSDTCAELGYLFAVHDQYRDFYFNAASFDERLTAIRADGSREEHSTWCGGPQTILSPRFAPEYVRRNHDLFAAHGIKVRGAYLDVFAVVPLEESFQPTQPVSRTECAGWRRECFDLLRARGYVVSSEEPADYLVPSLDLVHHGPYATYPNIGGGEACGVPVPLFNLVYHDSILLPWDTGDDGGWGVPKGDAAWLHCLLNAGLPYAGIGAQGEQVKRINELAKFAEHCAFFEMVNHELLDGSQRKQRTTFSDGTQITVDFDAKSYKIEYGQATE